MENEHKVIPGVHLLFRRFNEEFGENEYLLHRRINTRFFDDHFSLPGGHIDGYESPIDCVIREANEELAVIVKPEHINLANVIYRLKRNDDEVRIDFCFLISEWKGEFSANEPHKHTEPRWYTVSKFPEPMVPYVKQAINDIEKGIIYTKTDI